MNSCCLMSAAKNLLQLRSCRAELAATSTAAGRDSCQSECVCVRGPGELGGMQRGRKRCRGEKLIQELIERKQKQLLLLLLPPLFSYLQSSAHLLFNEVSSLFPLFSSFLSPFLYTFSFLLCLFLLSLFSPALLSDLSPVIFSALWFLLLFPSNVLFSSPSFPSLFLYSNLSPLLSTLSLPCLLFH